MRKKNVTIADIAKRTGYSKTTVSFAFNWPNRISSSTVEKIMDCAKELGYHGINDQLQDSTSRYKNICVLVPEYDPITTKVPVWTRAVYAVYKLCAAHSFMVSVIDEKRASDMFFAKYSAVDAFMCFTDSLPAQFLEVQRKRKLPVISVCVKDESKVVSNAEECASILFAMIKGTSLDEYAGTIAFSFFETNHE